MGVLEKVMEELLKQGKSQKELTDYLGIDKNTFTNWKAGKSTSYIKHANEIACFLGVTTDYLFGRQYKMIGEKIYKMQQRIQLDEAFKLLKLAEQSGDKDLMTHALLHCIELMPKEQIKTLYYGFVGKMAVKRGMVDEILRTH